MGVLPFRLKPWFSERPWGRRDLRPWYADTGTTELVGEAWLTGPQCVVETGAFAGRTWLRLRGVGWGVSFAGEAAVSCGEAVGAGASG